MKRLDRSASLKRVFFKVVLKESLPKHSNFQERNI